MSGGVVFHQNLPYSSKTDQSYTGSSPGMLSVIFDKHISVMALTDADYSSKVAMATGIPRHDAMPRPKEAARVALGIFQDRFSERSPIHSQ
jgi:hypothetical protein